MDFVSDLRLETELIVKTIDFPNLIKMLTKHETKGNVISPVFEEMANSTSLHSNGDLKMFSIVFFLLQVQSDLEPDL